MLKSKIISLFLCLLLLVQVLPLQQIGNALGQNQWTEELPHGDDCPVKGCVVDFFSHPFLPPHDFIELNNSYVVNIDLAYIHFSERIPHNHSADIESPPPDCFI
jgi:hypothetical protein